MPCHQHGNASLRDISSLRLLSGARKLVRVGPRSNRGVHIEESFAPGRLGLRGDDDKRVASAMNGQNAEAADAAGDDEIALSSTGAFTAIGQVRSVLELQAVQLDVRAL